MKTKQERAERRLRMKNKFVKFFTKIKNFFKKFGNETLPMISATALKIMQGIKKVVGSEVVDFITDFIPNEADDILVDKIRKAVDKSISTLTILDSCNKEFETIEEKILCFVVNLKSQPKAIQNAIYTQLHAQILAELDDNDLSLSEYTLLASLDYLESKIENA